MLSICSWVEGDFKISIERKGEQEESEGKEEREDKIGRGKGRGKEREATWEMHLVLSRSHHDSSNNKPRELV